MKFDWDEDKNQWLILERGVSFPDVLKALEEGRLLLEIAGTGRYAHQRQFIVNINGYPYVVPFVRDGDTLFLKTIFPSRKHKYLIKPEADDENPG